jgi:ABC-type proline/glycine betaine transport system permease subunit
MMLREKLIEQCIQAMKRDDVKKELKQMFHPVIDMIMQEIYPYIYLSVVFVMISFLLTLSIFVLLLRTSYFRQLALDAKHYGRAVPKTLASITTLGTCRP